MPLPRGPLRDFPFQSLDDELSQVIAGSLSWGTCFGVGRGGHQNSPHLTQEKSPCRTCITSNSPLAPPPPASSLQDRQEGSPPIDNSEHFLLPDMASVRSSHRQDGLRTSLWMTFSSPPQHKTFIVSRSQKSNNPIAHHSQSSAITNVALPKCFLHSRLGHHTRHSENTDLNFGMMAHHLISAISQKRVLDDDGFRAEVSKLAKSRGHEESLSLLDLGDQTIKPIILYQQVPRATALLN